MSFSNFLDIIINSFNNFINKILILINELLKDNLVKFIVFLGITYFVLYVLFNIFKVIGNIFNVNKDIEDPKKGNKKEIE